MEQDTQGAKGPRYALNMTLAGIAGQVGCLTLAVILLALFAGLWLDNNFDSRPLFTLILLIGSVPVTLFLMFRVVRAATERIKPADSTQILEEDS